MILYDIYGNPISTTDRVGGDTFLDTRPSYLPISALNGEVVMPSQGVDCISLDLKGTFVAQFVVEYSINGSDYFGVPLFNPSTEQWLTVATVIGNWVANLPLVAKYVRVRCTSWTSGSANVSLRGKPNYSMIYAKQIPITATITTTGAAGAAVTATLPLPGVGLYHYISRILVQRICAATLVGAAIPVIITTANMPGSRNFSIPADGSTIGSIYSEILEFNNPLKSITANSVTTIVCPATTSVIWRVTVDFYVGA